MKKIIATFCAAVLLCSGGAAFAQAMTEVPAPETPGVEIEANVQDSLLTPEPVELNYAADSAQVRAFVTRLYTEALGRNEDPAGLEYWTNSLLSGERTAASAIHAFFLSEEFVNELKLSNREQVRRAYKTMLDRDPDAEGWAYWEQNFNSGISFAPILKGFVASTEYQNICASYGIAPGDIEITEARDKNIAQTAFVQRLYTVCMERAGDREGVNYWCGGLQAGTFTGISTAANFVFSPEFSSKNYDNATWIKLLYNAFFGREADAGGLAYWVGRLNSGESKQAILNAMALGSEEFAKMCSNASIPVGQKIDEPPASQQTPQEPEKPFDTVFNDAQKALLETLCGLYAQKDFPAIEQWFKSSAIQNEFCNISMGTTQTYQANNKTSYINVKYTEQIENDVIIAKILKADFYDTNTREVRAGLWNKDLQSTYKYETVCVEQSVADGESLNGDFNREEIVYRNGTLFRRLEDKGQLKNGYYDGKFLRTSIWYQKPSEKVTSTYANFSEGICVTKDPQGECFFKDQNGRWMQGAFYDSEANQWEESYAAKVNSNGQPILNTWKRAFMSSIYLEAFAQ